MTRLPAWLVAECKAYGVGMGCVGFIVVIVLAFFKEWLADKQFDERDFWYPLWEALFHFF